VLTQRIQAVKYKQTCSHWAIEYQPKPEGTRYPRIKLGHKTIRKASAMKDVPLDALRQKLIGIDITEE